MRVPSGGALGLTAAALALATACGSTVAPGVGDSTSADGSLSAPAGGSSAVGAQGDGLSVPAGSVNGAGGVAGTGEQVGTTLTAGGVGTTSTTAGPAAASSSTTLAGHGPIEVGITYKKNLGQTASALGFKSIGTADGRAIYDAIVDEVNKTGGFGGRQIRPIYHAIDSASTETYDQLDQEICTDWTQDHHIALAATAGSFSEVLEACLQKANVPMFFVNARPEYRAAYEKFPLLQTLWPNQDRTTVAWVDSLARTGYFKPVSAAKATKVGVLRYDQPDQAAVYNESLAPTLARHGLKVDFVGAVNLNSSDGGISQLQNMMLQMQTRGITHVLPEDPDGNLTLFGMKAASSNDYHPRWALSTYALPYIQATNGQDQLHAAQGFGWAPTIDVDAAHDPKPTAAHHRCMAVMKKHGVLVPDRTAEFAASYSCDTLFLAQRATRHLSDFSTGPLHAALAALGTVDSATVMAATYTPTQPDAASLGRSFVYVDRCSCFTYTGRAVQF